MEGQGFKKLRAWELADDLASAVFQAAQQLPQQHRWLASQISRAAVSVPANIAEGYGRGSLGDYLRFLDIARGSLSEVEYYIHFLAKEDLIDETTDRELSLLQAESGRLLFGLWRSLKAKSSETWDHVGSSNQIRELRLETYEAEE
ncbi:MAG TPA: four helix bundle protein [Dehalococcoidia bacterium]|nr:four helix bundle protein [Dehalococcoidia bacterium]